MKRITSNLDIEQGLDALARLDPRLEKLRDLAGPVPLRLAEPGFAGLASIVISQQVSRASATAIQKRLAGRLKPLDAMTLLGAGENDFREAGLSRPKQRTLVELALAVRDGHIDLHAVCEMKADTAMESLTRIRGIGPWTAEVYLMFCAGHPDIFPAGDLALREAARAALGLAERPDDRQLRAVALGWSPWRSVAARLLWAYYAKIARGRDAMPL